MEEDAAHEGAELLIQLNDEQVEAELSKAVALLRARNDAIESQLRNTDAEMTEGILLREAQITRNSEAAASLLRENAVLHDRYRAERARFDAALLAQRNTQDADVANLERGAATKRNDLQGLRDFQRMFEALTDELRELGEEKARRQKAYEERILELEQQLGEKTSRWEAELQMRADAAHLKLEAKVKLDVFKKFETMQAEHARMKAELGYQAHRVELLANANMGLLKRQTALEQSLRREYATQDALSRCVRYHAGRATLPPRAAKPPLLLDEASLETSLLTSPLDQRSSIATTMPPLGSR
ncbi:hypothetical protein M885DRAFT_505121 [Pelagophyceae sp. CCMP2097]|nr:hypothetical protein M885DRAFT_505121 [Pelagophyceae sp. CCMP2097]